MSSVGAATSAPPEGERMTDGTAAEQSGDPARGAGGVSTRSLFSAERAKAFVDAVVAIAMTLLILPLMESVGEAQGMPGGAAAWLGEHAGQLISFVLSFWIIAMFWIAHHELFADVERVTERLLWLTVCWMLTIVWMPVATAMTGQLEPEPLVKVLYIGTMALTKVFTLLTRLYLRAHPELHALSAERLRRGMIVDVTMGSLFLIALGIAVLVPAIGYFSLFLLMLIGPITRMLMRRTSLGR